MVPLIVFDKTMVLPKGTTSHQEVDSEYVVLLNSDIETTEGWLDPLIHHLDTHPETAAVQPKLRGFFDRKNLNMPARQEASSTGMRLLFAADAFSKMWKPITDSTIPLFLFLGYRSLFVYPPQRLP